MNVFLGSSLAHKPLLTFLTCSLLTIAVSVYGPWRITEPGHMLSGIYTGSVLPAQQVSEPAARLTARSRAHVRLPAVKEPSEVMGAVDRARIHMEKFHDAIENHRGGHLSEHEQELLKQLDGQLPILVAEVNGGAELRQVAAQEMAGSSVELAEKTGGLLDAIVPGIRQTSELVREISTASQEQSTGVEQIGMAVAPLNQVTQQNASSSEELAATAEEMSAQAQSLRQAMAFFRSPGAAASRSRMPQPAQERRPLPRLAGLSRV